MNTASAAAANTTTGSTPSSKRPLDDADPSDSDSDEGVNWESDNDNNGSSSSSDEEENRFSDLQNNLDRNITIKLSGPDGVPPLTEEKKKAKKKRRKSVTKSRRSLFTLAKKFPSLLAISKDLHCSVVTATIASARYLSSVASSETYRAQVVSCFPLGGMALALDSAYFEKYDGSREVGSRHDLHFLFGWFCEACCLHSKRTTGSGAKKKQKKKRRGGAWAGAATGQDVGMRFVNLIGRGISSDTGVATLFASLLRSCGVRTRLVVNIPTPLVDDVEVFSRKESADRVLHFGLEIVRMLTGGGAPAISPSLNTNTHSQSGGGGGGGGSSSANPIEIDEDVGVGVGVGAMPGSVEEEREKDEALRNPAFCFVEALCEEEKKWVVLDPLRGGFDCPECIEQRLKKFWSDHPRKNTIIKEARGCVSYVVGVEGDGDVEPLVVTDVTRRYAASFATTQTLRVGDGDHWFNGLLKKLGGGGLVDLTVEEGEEGKVDDMEKEELEAKAFNEKPPKSKEGFRNHPKFALKSQFKAHEVLKPNATKKSGMFSGEFIFKREDVSVARSAKKWLYEGRKVKESELDKPVKKVKKKVRPNTTKTVSVTTTTATATPTTTKKVPTNQKFTALKSYNLDIEGTASSASEQRRLAELDASTTSSHGHLSSSLLDLYGHWQTEPYVLPYINADEPIPKNEYGNIELALLNPGLVHVPITGLARAAKKLGISYAPCLIGFDPQTGNPRILGIVVHAPNRYLITEASKEVTYHKEKEYENIIMEKWKRIVRKIVIGERLKEEYL
ncbi:hypothetical protein TrVE_jg6367 [Triparma verrucosa]|uniref:Uncharacterized protein n=1 Tax=Triparma verrucosa TaxID=1606542 RepID=A0A9W7B7K5_9STRA|nr:hypothetical protein TrVE_jg6367 [Triparma verrucosa]